MTDRGRRWLIGSIVAVIAIVALGYGAIVFYAKVLNDSPDALDEGDLSERVNATEASDATATTPTPSATSGTSAPASSPDTATATTAGESDATDAAAADGDVDGNWVIADGSVVRYRVDEVLAGVNTTAVGETESVDGSLTIAGNEATEAEFTVDVATMKSNRDQRDGQFNGRIMETEQFPTATFALTEPVDFEAIPDPGEQVTASATGELTMHGVTNTVRFDVTAEAGSNRIGVLGSIPIVFADYDIDDPSFGPVTTEDNGSVEFVLVFERG